MYLVVLKFFVEYFYSSSLDIFFQDIINRLH